MSARDIACGLLGLRHVRSPGAVGLCVVERVEWDAALRAFAALRVVHAEVVAENDRLRLDVAGLRERLALLEAASLDLAGVAMDNRAPGDRSTRGVRP